MQRGMSAKETAKYLSVSVTTVYRLTAKGSIPAPTRVGGSRRWDRIKLDEMFDENAPSTPSEAWDEALQ